MNPSRTWVFLFFFISGATGLIYEVVWTRLLTLVMGNTQYSVATVLTVFMGGLALGSYLGGRWVDKTRDPLILYAVLEGAIGVFCLLVPFLIEGASPAFKWIYIHLNDSYTQASLFRFLICGSFLLVPTTLMGATLPVLSKFVSRKEEFIGRDVGTLYAMNTFGAVIGALSSAFLLMRLLGIQATVFIAAGLNIAIALLIILLFRRPATADHLRDIGPERGSPEEVGERSSPEEFFILTAFGVSGLCALVYQVAWNRILSLLLGSSIYAFSLILTTFILGLALGTVFFSTRVHRFEDLYKVFGLQQAGIGFSALAVLPLFGEIPFVNRWVYQNVDLEFASIQWAIFLIIFALLFVPTFLMGGQFPVVVRMVVRHLPTLGKNVGRVYASNTVGTIAGSFLGGFVLIPWLGIQNTILLIILINVSIGILFLYFSTTLTTWIKGYSLPLLLFLCVFWGGNLEAWDKAVISSGSYLPYRIKDLAEAELKKNKILYYEEGKHTTVTTELSISGNIFLRVNGKTDASLALDMRTQVLSGYLPMMMVPNPRSVLVIGQGSGITLGGVEQFSAEEIDLVEISPAVIKGSRFFSPFNHNSLEDPRVRLILEDGRNHVALTDKKYDVIISEPSNPWISGVGALFTVDFFELAKERLHEGGVVCIWVHTNMSPESFKSIVKSFGRVFPHVTMWESIVGDDYLLIGSEREYSLPYEFAENMISDPLKGSDLRKIGIFNVKDLMSLMIMGRESLKKFSKEAPLHTDNNSLLEFSAPRYIYKDERNILVRQLSPHVKIEPSLVTFEMLDEHAQETILAQIARLDRSASQVVEIKRQARVMRLLDEAEQAFNTARVGQAIKVYREIIEIDPGNAMAYLNLGNVYHSIKREKEAEEAHKTAVKINPYYIFGNLELAKLYLSTHRAQEAVNVLSSVVEWNPGDSEVRLYLGLAYSFQKDESKAIREMEEAVRLDPGFALAYYYLGVQLQNRNLGLSRRHLKKFLRLTRSGTGSDKMIDRAEKLLKKL